VIDQSHKYSQIAIDCNNLYWRSVTSCAKKLQKIDSVFIYTHVILDFLGRIKEFQDQFGYKDSIIYLLFDNPKSKITTRKIIDDHYKSHRCNDNVPKQFWDTLALLEIILRCYSSNFVIMRLDNYEADDLIYPLITQKVIDKEKMLLISVDLDWSRGLALSENVHLFNYQTLFWHKSIFKDQYGFYPEGNKIKFYKTFKGDKSDDISPGVPNLPQSILNHIVNTYNDIDIFINSFNQDEKISTQWKIKILENRSKILSNYFLVDFMNITQDLESYSFKCNENINELRYWYKLLDLPVENRMVIKELDKLSFLTVAQPKRLKKV
jgi:5'-3' exonuclease